MHRRRMEEGNKAKKTHTHIEREECRLKQGSAFCFVLLVVFLPRQVFAGLDAVAW